MEASENPANYQMLLSYVSPPECVIEPAFLSRCYKYILLIILPIYINVNSIYIKLAICKKINISKQLQFVYNDNNKKEKNITNEKIILKTRFQ